MNTKSKRHYVVCGSIPGRESFTTMSYIQAERDRSPIDIFIHEVLYKGKMPLDWRSRNPTPNENPHGRWAYVHKILEFSSPPLDSQNLVDLRAGAVVYPPHDPSRFKTTDGFESSDQTNGVRSDSVMHLLKNFQRNQFSSDNLEVIASDFICNLLHCVHSFGHDPAETLKTALAHFDSEARAL
ncbi:MAG: hypothetical protein WCO57_12105 [Verrucomicrobiota bacterium]